MFEDIKFSFGFYQTQSKNNELIKIESEEELNSIDNELVFGLEENIYFESDIPLYHGNIYYVKEKDEYIAFHYDLNRDNNNILGYGFSYFGKFMNQFYDYKLFTFQYGDCSFEFIGNIFIHNFYLFEVFSKKINLANIFYTLSFQRKKVNLKVTFDNNTLLFSSDKESVNIEKKLLYKSLNYPNSTLNFKIEKKLVNKNIIEGFNNSIFYLNENDEFTRENSCFLLFLKNGLVEVINSELEEISEVSVPFIQNNWLVTERESNSFKSEFLKFIS